MQHPFGILMLKLRLIRLRRYRERLLGGPAEDGVTKAMLATCSMSLSGHLWRSAESSPLLSVFHKIHSDTVSLDKDKYLTPATRSVQTRAPHNCQYCRYQAYSDALQNSFSLGLFQSGIVFLPLWYMPRPQRSLTAIVSFCNDHLDTRLSTLGSSIGR